MFKQQFFITNCLLNDCMSTVENVRLLQERLAISGDETAYRELFGVFRQPLMRYAFSVFPVKEAAEEIVSDVFIKLWEIRKQVHKIDNLKLYLFKATHNTALNYLRNHKKHQYEILYNVPLSYASPSPNPEQVMMNSELENRLRKAISELPPKCRLVFLLAKEYKLKYREISEILNISVKTIDNQLAIAVKKLALAINVKLKKNSRSFF